MTLRMIEIFSARGHADTIEAIAGRFQALTFWKDSPQSGATEICRLVARPEKQQELIDQLQGALGMGNPWRITIMPIEATIPEVVPLAHDRRSPEQATREELYAEIDRGCRIEGTFLQLVFLSTVVAAIGLLESNVAIIVGAMLIAPLFGPNVALAFGSTLGDRELIARAATTNAAGVGLTILCAAAAGFILQGEVPSVELLARTRLGYDSILLALASGAAGALSLTTRLPSILTGVMVAVALMPPATTLGFMIGSGRISLAVGAAALLVANIVCVSLSAQLVFLSKGIKPRTWIQRRAAKQSTQISLAIAAGFLSVLVAIVFWQTR